MSSDPLARLTPKELACLRLVAQRMSSKEIAGELGIAKTSVDTYCNRARAKLGVGGRYEAARLVRAVDVADDRPATISAPAAVIPEDRAAAAAATLRLLGAGVAATLAFGALLAGLHALDAMRPLPASDSHVAAGPGYSHTP